MGKNTESATDGSGIVDLHDAIRRRAEEIYVLNGRIPGRDLENWAQAEREIRRETPGRRTAIVIKIAGVNHVGEYRADLPDGYVPGEFTRGEPVEVRIDGDRMFVRRPNGKELETRIVKRVS